MTASTLSMSAPPARFLPAAGLSPSGALAFFFIAADRPDKSVTPSLQLSSRVGSPRQ